jgi:hypothetical protein
MGGGDLGRCGCPKFQYDYGDGALDVLVYFDADAYWAEFYTGRHFGCVHHEVRE